MGIVADASGVVGVSGPAILAELGLTGCETGTSVPWIEFFAWVGASDPRRVDGDDVHGERDAEEVDEVDSVQGLDEEEDGSESGEDGAEIGEDVKGGESGQLAESGFRDEAGQGEEEEDEETGSGEGGPVEERQQRRVDHSPASDGESAEGVKVVLGLDPGAP